VCWAGEKGGGVLINGGWGGGGVSVKRACPVRYMPNCKTSHLENTFLCVNDDSFHRPVMRFTAFKLTL